MPSSYTLGAHYEKFIKSQLASGRYNNASEVIRDALRVMEGQEARNRAIHQAIARGIEQAEAGHLIPMEQVFDALSAEISAMPDSQA